jgi:predicted nucleic acid-binding protein
VIALSRIGCLELLPALFETICIPMEVYNEVVIAGARRPGAEPVARAPWIKVTAVDRLAASQQQSWKQALDLAR